ncbi:hypothetical protein KQX54_018698 [Cotesia glomerata]|uniref:Uncharacterized protein n=1 Tax=Cotesia glomerata TaxID=32391 RepID=A0AAV7I7P3_COTGL|nr:hypothetical protein KQX54_018698 [Cotesia glomerata]
MLQKKVLGVTLEGLRNARQRKGEVWRAKGGRFKERRRSQAKFQGNGAFTSSEGASDLKSSYKAKLMGLTDKKPRNDM